MLTRSQSKKTNNLQNKTLEKTINVSIELEVNIDFDDSSREWRKNKRSIGNGQFKYIKKSFTIGVIRELIYRVDNI